MKPVAVFTDLADKNDLITNVLLIDSLHYLVVSTT